ncbi:multidrug resistance-like ATP-binding protein MdlB-like protein [Anopheles sinensis]|uniref:Multidrug resistance-like ATP-binding protein MdlB-like protein n=1 Tax=Anopheles sinensis TaxID=74873 RepID=A0A084VHN7_ANOSI|nr:multidrug resistance-like ATP-binding protein MdlB-like protein [Anopheles sinensis]
MAAGLDIAPSGLRRSLHPNKGSCKKNVCEGTDTKIKRHHFPTTRLGERLENPHPVDIGEEERQSLEPSIFRQ